MILEYFLKIGLWSHLPIFHINLTPQPPYLHGKGEKSSSPLRVGEGLGERSAIMYESTPASIIHT
ncbi:MAG TPA: hypothetical protein DEF48_03545 [Nostoc sp. UBA8866]|nr:hypothetical protein [Nostoc sp. UBA8866]